MCGHAYPVTSGVTAASVARESGGTGI